MIWNMYKSSLCRFLIDKFAGKNLFAALESAQLRILNAKHDAYLGSDLLFILMAAPPSVCLSDSPFVWQFVRAWCWILSEASSFIYACHSSDALMRALIHDAAREHRRAGGRCVQGTSWQRRQHLAGKTAQRSVTALDAFVWLAVLITRQRQNISSIRRVVCGARRMFHNVALTVSVTVPAPAPAPVPVPAPAWRLVRPQSEMAEMLLHTKRTLWPHVALFAAGNEPSTHFALQIAIN